MTGSRVSLVAVLLTSACFNANFVRVPSGELATKGVTITSEDGTFKVTAGQTFQSPARCVGRDQDEYTDALRVEHGNFLSHTYSWQPTADSYPRSLRHGAFRVRVAVPGMSEPLYGVLALYCVVDQFDAPGAKSYLLQVPQSYVDATSEGRVSVVFETINNLQGEPLPTWALWLSRRPLP
jgi:hypothetical protein